MAAPVEPPNPRVCVLTTLSGSNSTQLNRCTCLCFHLKCMAKQLLVVCMRQRGLGSRCVLVTQLLDVTNAKCAPQCSGCRLSARVKLWQEEKRHPTDHFPTTAAAPHFSSLNAPRDSACSSSHFHHEKGQAHQVVSGTRLGRFWRRSQDKHRPDLHHQSPLLLKDYNS